jgi:hypothetical protein
MNTICTVFVHPYGTMGPGEHPETYRLRNIHRFKILIWGSRMIGRAENYGQLGDNMQASRKHRSTMEVLFKNTLTCDISRRQQTDDV